VGDGQFARILSSLVVAGEVGGNGVMGGLVGDGQFARIISSSVVVGEVAGESGEDPSSDIGGLVGRGISARIISSSVVAAEVSGEEGLGGLVGRGDLARIISSSVVVGEVSGSDFIGGLAGDFLNTKFAYSYVISGGTSARMLAGSGTGTGVASYWDSETSGVSNGNNGEAKTTSELRTPTGYEEIYASWDNGTDIFGDGEDVPLAVWCDKDNSGSIEDGEKTDGNRVWDFGTSIQYPAIRCTPITPAEWRSWWSLGSNDDPQLDQTRLDDLLP